MKQCFRCKTSKDISYFTKNNNNSDKLHSWCKPCLAEHKRIYRVESGTKEWEREYYRKNKDSINLKRRARKFKINVESLKSILDKKQCDCCGDTRQPDQMVIDHDHKTGKVRGYLCCKCNAGIGFFDENPVKLNLAISYLRTVK